MIELKAKPPILALIQPIWLRVLVGVVLTILASFGVIFLSPENAELFVRYTGYYFTLVACLGAIFYGVVSWKKLPLKSLPRNEYILGVLFVLGGAYIVFLHSNLGYKIAMDDYLLSATAKQLHETREVAYAVWGEKVSDTFIQYGAVVDKRPWFYPFLVSCAHDVFGYSPQTPFIINVAFGGVFLGLVYFFGFLFSGRLGGVLSVLLWASLPLLSQNATGGGMEMLNLLMIQLLMLVSVVYLRSPSVGLEGLLSLIAVLLTYARYESGLFLMPTLIIILLGWWRRRQILLSWGSVLAPCLLFAVVLQTRIYAATESSWELAEGVDLAFSFEHFSKNWPHALNFFFNTGDGLANSLLLGIVAFPVVLSFFILLRTELKRYWQQAPVGIVTAVFSVFLLIHFCIVLCYHSAELDARYVARYSLPFHILIVTTFVALFAYISRKWNSAFKVGIAVAGLYIFALILPVKSKGIYNDSNFMVREFDWLTQLTEDHFAPRGLVIDEYPAFWSLIEWSCLSQKDFILNSDKMIDKLTESVVVEIYVIRRARFEAMQFVSKDALFDEISQLVDLELVAEKSFYPLQITQVFRVKTSHQEQH